MKHHALVILTLALLSASLTACVPARTNADLAPVDRELNRIRQDQQQLTQQVEQNRNNLLLIEAKVRDQQTLISDLRRELATKKVTPPREITSSSRPGITSATSSAAIDYQNASPTEIYLQAFSDYAAGRFEQAIQGFETFLQLHAGSDYAGNAQYWLGECYYSQQQYARAVEEFQRTVERYPQGGKTPDALLKMAAALTQLGQPDQAQEALQVLRSRYPNSPAARKPLNSN
jgi:tol-pal system protein YbgF